MGRYGMAATGGTFDLLHKGHLELLRGAFDAASSVVIGLTSDYFAAGRGKTTFHNYIQRFENLASLIRENFPDAQFSIRQLDDDFGPAVFEENLDALIVSDETQEQGARLNELRALKGLSSVDIVVIPMAMARDGCRISSTRIKNSEIDFDGNLT